MLTRGTIKKKELAVRAEALYTVLPGLEGLPVEISPTNSPEQDHVYKGLNKAGQVVGYAASGEFQGYSSKIKVMVGIDPNLEKVLGINILAQNETPWSWNKDDRDRKHHHLMEPHLWQGIEIN